ncbi:hypothetical protein X801_01088 [Opisthorchis viverrini]|uniref:Uncharacterized protein n=1 Tax=Opisthorchis viverrini TaxID=6198 RepID=A0A1S8X8F7_OPIVI|nr:hypothetical protein X801_01088 [Opisthorchis viverrini]
MDLARFTQHFYYNAGRKEDYKMASAAISFAGFLESLPNDEERRKLGYLHEKLIIKCQLAMLELNYPNKLADGCSGSFMSSLALEDAQVTLGEIMVDE